MRRIVWCNGPGHCYWPRTGVSSSEISEVVGISCPTVLAWRGQFERDGLIGFGEVAKGRGRAGTMTHDDKRHGTTTLFAALDVLTGTVIGRCLPQHRNTEFLKFLRIIDREVPQGLQIHMICDNYGAHKHANVKAWLAKHPWFHLHFTPRRAGSGQAQGLPARREDPHGGWGPTPTGTTARSGPRADESQRIAWDELWRRDEAEPVAE